MEKKIKILPRGPYMVSGEIPMRIEKIETDGEGGSESWRKGKECTKQQEPYCLCRCGQSKKKPHCDGTHVEIGFEGEETADKGSRAKGSKHYVGKTVDLLDDESLCASLRFCDRGIGVWQAVLDSDDEANRKMAIQQACNCSAGRLTVLEKDGTPIEKELEMEISPIQDTAAGWRGPLAVKGGIPLEGADGALYEARNRMTLCRCGESDNMPFCDISHLQCTHMKGFDE